MVVLWIDYGELGKEARKKENKGKGNVVNVERGIGLWGQIEKMVLSNQQLVVEGMG